MKSACSQPSNRRVVSPAVSASWNICATVPRPRWLLDMSLFLAAATTSSVHETEQLVFFTLIQLLAILVSARLAGKLASLLGQPRVVGEIVGGLIMGPS